MNKKLILKGIPASVGVASGPVKIVRSRDDAKNFNDGDILVTEITDPTMVNMMSRSAAIVCNVGSITSHPSIVSRELGIPCVVNAKDATTILKDSMQITVDGTKGEVYEA